MIGFIKRIFGIEEVDLQHLLDRGAMVVDVRSPGEFKTGHPKGSLNIPLPQIGNKIIKIRNHKKPIITCCVSGRRSGMVARQLKAAGIEAYNGGAWQSVSRAIKERKSKNKNTN